MIRVWLLYHDTIIPPFFKTKNFLQCLCDIPMDKPVIHDIHLSFSFEQIWPILFVSSFSWLKNIDTKSNKDITFHDIDLGDHIIKTTVHKSDTVSVIVVCTLSPIPIDMLGRKNIKQCSKSRGKTTVTGK
jgi:hypothetical protein